MRFSFIGSALIMLIIGGCTTFKAEEDMVLFNDQPLYPGQERVFKSAYNTDFARWKVDDTTKLHTAWVHRNPGTTSKTVLYFGGNGFRIGIQGREKAAPYTRLDYNVLLFDYRGYGWSDGRSNMKALKRDALAIYDSLITKKEIHSENIVLHGHSIGSLLAAHVAQNREAGALVLESSVTTMQEWWKEVTPWFLRIFIKFEAADGLKGEGNKARVKELELPVLFIGGSADPITPPALTKKLYQQSATPESEKMLHIFEGADHNSVTQHKEFVPVMRSFME